MARVNVDILGIRELKWTGMGEFTQMTIISTIWAGIPQKKWSSHHGQQKSPKCSTWMQSQKRRNDVKAETPVLWPPHAELTHWKRLMLGGVGGRRRG